MPELPVLSHTFETLDLLTSAHPLLESEFFQTQAGSFQGEVLGIALPNGYFWRSRWNLGGPGWANLKEDYFMVGLPTNPHRDFWHGSEIGTQTVATTTWQLGLQHRCLEAHESLAWMIRWARIQEICENLGICIPKTLASQPIHSVPEMCLRLYRKDIQEFISRAPQPNGLSRSLAEWFEEFLVYRLMACIVPVRDVERPVRTSATIAKKIARHLRQRCQGALSMSELCAELHLHERTLRQHFTSHFGVSPQTYHQNLRLNLLRQQLLVCPDSKGQVSHSAARLGFWHMGRMGQQYRKLFGETPTETLARKISGDFHQFWQSFYDGSNP